MDPYDTLGVRKDATKAEIHSAYKKLLDKYDLNNYAGDPTFANKRVEKITEAYKLLSNSEKKLEYDKAHQSHVESHKTKKDVFNPYYKKTTSSEHIHEDMKIAQDKYEKFQKYSNRQYNIDEQSKKALKTTIYLFVFFFVILPIFQIFISAFFMFLEFFN